MKRYFSYSFHLIFLKLYRNNGLGSLTMGCAQFADSAKFGILVNLFNIFWTNFGCLFATPQPFTIGFGPNYTGMWYIIVVYWIVLFFADSSISLFYTN